MVLLSVMVLYTLALTNGTVDQLVGGAGEAPPSVDYPTEYTSVGQRITPRILPVSGYKSLADKIKTYAECSLK